MTQKLISAKCAFYFCHLLVWVSSANHLAIKKSNACVLFFCPHFYGQKQKASSGHIFYVQTCCLK